MITLNYQTNTERMLHEDVGNYKFKNENDAIDFIDSRYYGKGIEIVFICMKGNDDEVDFFITDNYLKVQRFFKSDVLINNTWWLFEEPTYQDALEYCIDYSEVHKLGLK